MLGKELLLKSAFFRELGSPSTPSGLTVLRFALPFANLLSIQENDTVISK